jgi:dynein heavy chain, axonemal
MLKDIVQLVRGELSELDRITLGALVVIDVHGKDVLKYNLIDNNITSIKSFEWLSQLRYSFNSSDKVYKA